MFEIVASSEFRKSKAVKIPLVFETRFSPLATVLRQRFSSTTGKPSLGMISGTCCTGIS